VASYTIAAGEIAAYGKALAASTVDTVTFTASDRNSVRVYNDTGTAAIHFTTDGTTPTVNGANTYRVPASAGAYLTVEVLGGGATVVKLISSGTPTYSVEGSL
jgi:hypothetical protein